MCTAMTYIEAFQPMQELRDYDVIIKRSDFARAANRLGFVRIVRNDDLHVVISSDRLSRRELTRFGISHRPVL